MIEIKKTFSPDGLLRLDYLAGVAFSRESAAHRFIISGPAAFEGTVTASFMRADGQCVIVAGSLDEDGRAVVTADEDCYLIPGRLLITVYLTGEDSKICIYAGLATVYDDRGSGEAASGETTRTIEEMLEEILEDVDNAQQLLDDAADLLDDITDEGATQVAAVQAKGDEVLESIPSDYSTLSGDVGNLKSASSDIDTRTNQALAYANYGYDTAIDYPLGDSSTWGKGIGIKRDGTTVVLNKTATLSYDVRAKISGTFELSPNTAGVDAWTSGITLKAGHQYKVTSRLIGGTASYNGDNKYVQPVSVYAAGTHTLEGESSSGDGYIERTFTAAENKTYNFVLFLNKTALFTNAKYLITMQDLSVDEIVRIDGEIDSIDARVSALETDIPDYYFTDDYLSNRAKAINEISVGIGRQSLNALFFTDYHYEDNARKSPALMKYIIQNTGIRNVVFGGDAYNHDYTSQAGGCKKLATFLTDMDGVRSIANLYCTTGNHEMNNADGAHDSTEIPKAVAYNMLNEPVWDKISAVWGNGTTVDSNSFYIDDDVAKMRIYCVDCTSGGTILKGYIDSIYSTLSTVPDGYAVVLFSHTGLGAYAADDSEPPVYTVTALNERFELLMKFYKALNDGYSGTISGTIGSTEYSWSVDFSSCQRTFVCAIIGHSHVDAYYIFDGRFPVIATTCDTGAYRDTHPYRIAGTITEQAFDAVQIDVASSRIYCTRIGFGEDRTFSFGDDAGLIT